MNVLIKRKYLQSNSELLITKATVKEVPSAIASISATWGFKTKEGTDKKATSQVFLLDENDTRATIKALQALLPRMTVKTDDDLTKALESKTTKARRTTKAKKTTPKATKIIIQ